MDDRSGYYTRISIAFIVLPTVAVAVRFWSRAVVHHGELGWDDWTCLLALLFSLAVCALGIANTHYGFGRHLDTIPAQDAVTGLKLLFAAYYPFNLSLAVVKQSALFFYSRVFHTHSRAFQISIYVGHGLVAAWILFIVPISTCQCTPVSKAWDPSVPGSCLETFSWYLASAIFDAVLDLFVLLLPIPVLFRLQMKTSRKWMVAGAFMCGYCMLVASLGRLISIAQRGPAIAEDFTWNTVDVFLWSIAEPAIGIISICLPSWFCLFRQWRSHGVGSLFATRSSADSTPVHVLQDSPKNARSAEDQMGLDGSACEDGRSACKNDYAIHVIPKFSGTPRSGVERAYSG